MDSYKSLGRCELHEVGADSEKFPPDFVQKLAGSRFLYMEGWHEWFKAAVLKIAEGDKKPSVGSNPTPSA